MSVEADYLVVQLLEQVKPVSPGIADMANVLNGTSSKKSRRVRQPRPEPAGGWRWSQTNYCGLRVTVASATAPDVPHWCARCERAFSAPCHWCNPCSICKAERSGRPIPPLRGQLELFR